MRISVVIPAHNEEAFLPKALQAVLAQTLPPFEVIVVDNASTDRTREVAERFGVRVVYCPRKGVAYARQAGLLAARGEWVAMTDADSIPLPTWLQTLARHGEGVVALYGPLRFYGVSPWTAFVSEWGYRAFLNLMAFLGKPNLAGANMMFLREAALEVGGFPEVEAREDVLLGWKLKRVGKVRYVPEALVLTSPRRLKGGWVRFLAQQVKNLLGDPRGYFGEDGGRER
ncbi:glycosyl transferase [Thermus scotoductus]|uniref:Glycosyl transferase n=1 Tax=Thermus scotoductus TaxID=37636 RepID=A0A0N0IRE2_THESC|nr:glycosyltransferase family A protein [Thermus sp. PS18]KPD32557.1 glycosyl transferase [Thermus scotoductus]UZX14896.1 glycosyltransferase family 2 protein [Thermus sp. PS18]